MRPSPHRRAALTQKSPVKNPFPEAYFSFILHCNENDAKIPGGSIGSVRLLRRRRCLRSGRSSLRYDFDVAHWALGIALPYAMR